MSFADFRLRVSTKYTCEGSVITTQYNNIDYKDAVTVYTAKLVIPVTMHIIFDGAVAVRGSRVLHVGTRRWVREMLREELDATELRALDVREWDGIMTPGLVNAHTHLQYTGMASVGQTTYSCFRAWELAFNEIYDAPDVKPWHKWAINGARCLIEAGTTAAADVVSDMEAISALSSQGLHGIAYWEVMDWGNDAWTREGTKTLLRQLAAASADRSLRLGISPHAPYSLGSAALLDLPDIARSLGMRLHIHLGETPIEAGEDSDYLGGLSPWICDGTKWQSYLALKRAGSSASAIQFCDQLGVLGPDVHIAHGVYASREDRRILRQRGVAVALCPRSNRVTCSGRDAPVAHYLKEGNLIAIGSDSLSSSPSLDVLDDAAVLFELALKQGYDREDIAYRLIRALTLGGAEAMGLTFGPDRIGQINPGALADLAFFAVPVDASSPQGIEGTLVRFVCEGAGSCRAVVLSGNLVYDRIWA